MSEDRIDETINNPVLDYGVDEQSSNKAVSHIVGNFSPQFDAPASCYPGDRPTLASRDPKQLFRGGIRDSGMEHCLDSHGIVAIDPAATRPSGLLKEWINEDAYEVIADIVTKASTNEKEIADRHRPHGGIPHCVGISEEGVTARVVAGRGDHEAVNSGHCAGRLPMRAGATSAVNFDRWSLANN